MELDLVFTILGTATGGIIENAPVLVGLVLPPVVDVINKDVHEANERFIVTLLVCFLTAVFIRWPEVSRGILTSFWPTLSLIFFQSQAVFKLYFKNSALRQKLQERITQPEYTIPSRVKKEE